MLEYLASNYQEKSTAKNTCSLEMNTIQSCIVCDGECKLLCFSMCSESCLDGSVDSGGGGTCNSNCTGTCFSRVSIIGGK